MFSPFHSQSRGFPGGTSRKEPACPCKRPKRHRFDPLVGKIPWRRAQQPTAVFLPGESHGLPSIGSGRVGHDWDNLAFYSTFCNQCPALPWPGGEYVTQDRSWPHSVWNLNLQQNDTETENGRSSCIPPLPGLFRLGAKMSWFQLTSKPDSPLLLSFLFVLRAHYHSKNSLLHKQWRNNVCHRQTYQMPTNDEKLTLLSQVLLS